MTREIDQRHQEMRDRQKRFCRITFTKKDVDGGSYYCREVDDWDVCSIAPVSTYSGYGTQTFTSEQTHQRDALLALLEQAFNLGRADKARDIRNVLEIGA